LFAVRDAALVVLEESRQAKTIGKGLEAELEITAAGDQLALLQRHAAGLKEIVNVSRVTVVPGPALAVKAIPATGSKCARCWNFMPHVSNYGQTALKEMNILPPQPSAKNESTGSAA
jgi:isoleucyl-tRNA synthetase